MKRKLLIFIATATILALSGILAFYAKDADASDYHLVELNEASLLYKNYLPGGHDPLLNESGLSDRQLSKQLNLNLNVDVAQYLYWDNRVHATTDEEIENGQPNGHGQFRMIGWEFQLGVRVTDYLSVEYGHHSQHLLDAERPNRFPVEDSVGLKIYLYRAPAPRSSLF